MAEIIFQYQQQENQEPKKVEKNESCRPLPFTSKSRDTKFFASHVNKYLYDDIVREQSSLNKRINKIKRGYSSCKYSPDVVLPLKVKYEARQQERDKPRRQNLQSVGAWPIKGGALNRLNMSDKMGQLFENRSLQRRLKAITQKSQSGANKEHPRKVTNYTRFDSQTSDITSEKSKHKHFFDLQSDQGYQYKRNLRQKSMLPQRTELLLNPCTQQDPSSIFKSKPLCQKGNIYKKLDQQEQLINIPSSIGVVRCSGCGRVYSKKQLMSQREKKINFQPCQKCHKVYYCSEACLQTDEASHRSDCYYYVNGRCNQSHRKPLQNQWVMNGAQQKARRYLEKVKSTKQLRSPECIQQAQAIQTTEKQRDIARSQKQQKIEQDCYNGLEGPRPCLYMGGRRV